MNRPQYPLSPHLQVYRLPLTAWLSITHRMTGVLLVVGVAAFTIALLILANYPLAWQFVDQLASSYLLTIILLVTCFAFWLHWFHGLRHLIWDIGAGFDLRYARVFDYLELSLAVLLTISVWFVHLILT